MSDVTTAIVADLHLKPDNESELLAAFEETLDQITEYEPSDLVILGDMVHESEPSTYHRLLETALDVIRDTGLSFRCVPGNHDAASLDSDDFAEAVGHNRWTVDEQQERIYLDSNGPNFQSECARISSAQLHAIGEVLQSMRGAVIFVHHPVHYRDLQGNYWFHEYPEEAFCGNKRAVNEAWADDSSCISAVINGHLHEWSHSVYKGVNHFSIDAFNKLPEPDGETGAFAVLKDGDGLDLTHIAGDGTAHEVRLVD